MPDKISDKPAAAPPPPSPSPSPHHVVVVGAGFGGLACVRGLEGAGVRITLVDQRNHHLFQPLLYQVATAILSPAQIAWPVRDLMERRADVTTLLARVTGVDRGVDRGARAVRLEDGARLGYDTLVLATGARDSWFGHDDWARHAPGLKSVEDATHIRNRLLSAFEEAEREPDPQARRALLTFAIIGGGPTGVELAGSFADLARRALRPDFRNIDTAEARILLVEAGPRLLPSFDEGLSDHAARALQRLGVELRLGAPVEACTAGGIRIGDEDIPCRTVTWAAGVAASPAAEWLGAPGGRGGRVRVAPDLTLPGAPEIFVIGDTAEVREEEGGEGGDPVPGLAPAARQMGAHVARTIRARLDGRPAPGPFRYRHRGDLATVGRGAAVVRIGRLRLRGRPAWWFWGLVHIGFLVDFRSRLTVTLSWLWTHLRARPGVRLITREDEGGPR